ncbi:hypothetical protein [Limnoglobus roseus]|nr:hypothetical protein [Limnoglobus roseus]
MHARGGFHDARDGDLRATDALAFVRTLYDVEGRIGDSGLRDAGVTA